MRDSEGQPTAFIGSVSDITERKRAEDALRKKSEELERYFTVSLDLLCIADHDGHFIRLNPEWEKVLGYTTQELEGRLFLDFVHPDDLEETRAALSKLRAGEQALGFENRYRHKDGSYRWIEWRSQPQGNQIYAVARDITERKQMEDALRKSERMLLDSQAVAHIGSYTTNLTATEFDTNTWEASSEIYNIFGIDKTYPHTLAGWVGFIHPDSQEILFAYHKQVVEERKRFDHQYKIVRINDGEERWVQGTGEIEYDEKSNPVRMLGTIQDITERKRSLDALIQSEARHSTMVANISDVIGVIGIDGVMKYKSPNIEQWFGWQPQDLIGTDGWLTVHPDDLERIQKEFFALLEEENASIKVEYRYKCKDGTYKWINLTATNLLKNPAISGVLLNYHDITASKASEVAILRLNEELEQRVQERTAMLAAANQELEAFSYSVSHDLRTPLRGIDGFSQALLEDYQEKLDENGKHYLSRIRVGAQRMGQLIDDLLKLSHVNRCELRHVTIDLSELCRKVLDNLARINPDQRMEVSIQPELSTWADHSLLLVVLENLLRNAVKFTSKRQDPRIEVGETTTSKGERTFFVRDNGAGFDMAKAGKLFDAFQRLHAANEFEGTGIGLSIVHRILSRHGGRIWAEAEPGKGATFFFTLPGPGQSGAPQC